MRRKDSTTVATGEQGQQVFLPPRIGTSSDGEGLWGDRLSQNGGDNMPRPNSRPVTTGRTILDPSDIMKELFKGANMSDQYCPEDYEHRLDSYHTILPSMCSSTDSDSAFAASSVLTPIPKVNDSRRPLKSCPDWRYHSRERVLSLERCAGGEEAAEEALRRPARMKEIKVEECKARTMRPAMRRSGIVDGGLMISLRLASI
jgi:hypothetical protein